MLDINLHSTQTPPQFVQRFGQYSSDDYFCMRSFIAIDMNDRWLTTFAAPIIQATTGLVPAGILQCRKDSPVAIEVCGRLNATPQISNADGSQDGQRVEFELVGEPRVVLTNTYGALRPLCHAAVGVAEEEISNTLATAAEGMLTEAIQERLRVFNYIVGREALAGTPAEPLYRIPNRVTGCGQIEDRLALATTLEEATAIFDDANRQCRAFASGADARCEIHPSGAPPDSTTSQYGCSYHLPVARLEMMPSGLEFIFASVPENPFFDKMGGLLEIAGMRPLLCGRPDGGDGPSRDSGTVADSPLYTFFSGGVVFQSVVP